MYLERTIPESRPGERNGYADEDNGDVDDDVDNYERRVVKPDFGEEKAVLLALASFGGYISRKEPDPNSRDDCKEDYIRDTIYRHLDFPRPLQRIPPGVTTRERVPHIYRYQKDVASGGELEHDINVGGLDILAGDGDEQSEDNPSGQKKAQKPYIRDIRFVKEFDQYLAEPLDVNPQPNAQAVHVRTPLVSA